MGILDEIKITRKDTQDFISKKVRNGLRKKSGYDVDIQFGNIFITQDNEKVHADLTVSADISKEELMKILKDKDWI